MTLFPRFTLVILVCTFGLVSRFEALSSFCTRLEMRATRQCCVLGNFMSREENLHDFLIHSLISYHKFLLRPILSYMRVGFIAWGSDGAISK
jgi:hypothetical protein